MNDLVKNSIECRKQAFYNGYEIEDEDLKNKIEDLFNRINEFGESCNDVTDFETKFASSSLNQEYIDLFTTIATKCKAKVYDSENTNVKSDAQYILEDVASEVKYQAESMTQPLRRKLNQEAYDKIRDVPVVGDALNVKQHIDFFSKFKKKKDN